jgi:hypothetical protein
MNHPMPLSLPQSQPPLLMPMPLPLPQSQPPMPMPLPQSQPPFAFVAEFRSASTTAVPLPLPSVSWDYSDDDADYDDDVCMTDAWETDDDGNDDGGDVNHDGNDDDDDDDDDDNDDDVISSNAITDPADIEIEIEDRPTTTMESDPFLGSCWVVLPDLREVRRSCRLILKKSG